MKIKTKLSYGLYFLFSVIVVLAVLGTVYVWRLSVELEDVLKDNYQSLEYVDGMLQALDNHHEEEFRKILELQQKNITEPMEAGYTDHAGLYFEQWKSTSNDSLLTAVRQELYKIATVNREAIASKGAIAQQTAREATVWIGTISAICFIISFTLIVNFPGYIANPIARLTESIKAIANGKYEERLHFDSKDEFGDVASAFNTMSSRLEEYENSNLAKLLSEKKRIETLINRMHNPIIGLDEKGVVLFVNREMEAILGMEAEQLTGKRSAEIAKVNDLFRTLISDLSGNNSSAASLKIFVHGRESFFTREMIRVTTVPTGEKEDQLIGFVFLLTDITIFKERDLAKTNFIATISHELKTPISSLQMCVKLIQDNRVGELNEEQSSIVKTLSEETTRLSKITNELLDLTQVETGNIKLKLKPVQPLSVIEFAMEAVKVQADRRGIQVVADLSKSLPLIHADPDKTAWVLINLLTNAIRYSAENSEVFIHCETEGQGVKFVVEDTGIGIEARYVDKVFDRFFQVPGSPHGTGIGLAIAKEFIEAQGGRVFVKSDFGKGSRFGFAVPAIS